MKIATAVLKMTLVALAATAPVAGCSSNKNHEERAAAPEAPQPLDYEDEAAMKAACISRCTPDPGSKPVDVAAAEAGYDFAWVWQLAPGGGANSGRAVATFTYDDSTTEFVVPRRIWSTFSPYLRGGWEPIPDDVSGLAAAGPQWAIRLKGGPFTEYGGGMGQSFRTQSNLDTYHPKLSAAPSQEFPGLMDGFASGGAYDLSSWEGIAIWVRRGPDGQQSMRVGVTEKHSAEDLNSGALPLGATELPPGVSEGKHCKRWRICGCSGGTPCTPVQRGNVTHHYCFDPALDPPPDPTSLDDLHNYPACGPWRCAEKNSSTGGDDPLYLGKACTPFVQSDGRSDSFCYDPATDPTPPAKRERCNNPFSAPIKVTLDWQLIKVPFTELRQADESLVAGEFDLKSVKQIVVTYTGGWIDFYIANLGFYRKL